MLTPIGRLLFGVYILVLTAVFLMTGDKILGFLIIVTISVHLAGMYALRHPHSVFARMVFRRKFGPDTETGHMTKKELLQSGIRFLIMGLYPFLTLVGLGVLQNQWKSAIPESLAMAIIFTCAIFLAACIIGGIYLLIRGIFRSSGFVPDRSHVE